MNLTFSIGRLKVAYFRKYTVVFLGEFQYNLLVKITTLHANKKDRELLYRRSQKQLLPLQKKRLLCLVHGMQSIGNVKI